MFLRKSIHTFFTGIFRYHLGNHWNCFDNQDFLCDLYVGKVSVLEYGGHEICNFVGEIACNSNFSFVCLEGHLEDEFESEWSRFAMCWFLFLSIMR